MSCLKAITLGLVWSLLSSLAAAQLPGDPFGASQSDSSRPGDPFGATRPAASLPGDPFSSPSEGPSLTPVSDWSWIFGGYVESRNRFSTSGGPVVALTQMAFLEMTVKKGQFSLYGSARGLLEGAAHYWPGAHKAGWGDIKELYLTFDSENFDFWLGRKIHIWGVSDGYNPLDLFNPLDLRDPFLSGRGVNRVPRAMAGASLDIGPLNFEAIYLPTAGVLTMPEPGSPWEPEAFRRLRTLNDLGFLSLNRKNAPRRWFRDGEFGLKVSASVAGWDLSLLAYEGYCDEPLFKMALNPFVGLQAQGEYARYRAYGLAWAKGLGQGTFRGELAIKPDYPLQGDLNWRRGRLTQAVIGWDRVFEGSLYLNFQGFLEIRSGAGDWPRDDRHGLTYEINYQWAKDTWAIGARGQVYLTGEGALNEVFLEWRLDDHFKFSVGTLVFSGSREGVLGQFKDNDSLYFTARYSF